MTATRTLSRMGTLMYGDFPRWSWTPPARRRPESESPDEELESLPALPADLHKRDGQKQERTEPG